MARVTAAEVQAIMSSYPADLTAFIAAANVTVTGYLTGKGLEADQLKEIERWLAAHLAELQKPVKESLEMGPMKLKYAQGKLGLDLTRYGQQVKVLDTSGTLLAIDKPRATIRVLSESD